MDEIEQEYAAAFAAYEKALERLKRAKKPIQARRDQEKAQRAARWEARRLEEYKRSHEDEVLGNAVCQKAAEGMDAKALATHFGISLRRVQGYVFNGPSTFWAEALASQRQMLDGT
jgi:hypothetical protein